MSLGHRSNARKTFYQASWDTERPDGRIFDSMLEASVARDLDILYKAKKIKAVRAQVPFDLHGKRKKIFTHIVDFLVTCNNGKEKVLEAKGEETDIWKAKRNLFIDNHPEIEYITVKREDLNYGKLIDVSKRRGALPPNTYADNVKEMEQHFTKKI